MSSNIASGQIGPHALNLVNAGSGQVAPVWGAVAFFNAASGGWFTIAPGKKGQVLTTQGSGFDPTWT